MLFRKIEWYGSYAFLGFLSLMLVYGVSAFKNRQPFWWLLPSFLIVNMGLSLRHTFAVVSGWFGKKSSFIRTPKSGGKSDIKNLRLAERPSGLAEGILACVFLMTGYFGLMWGQMIFSLLHTMMGIGFLLVAVFLFRDR